MAKIIDGVAISKKIHSEIKDIVNELEIYGTHPHLAVILIGNDPASAIYVAAKKRVCEEVGIDCTIYKYDSNIREHEVVNIIKLLNDLPSVHGILVQMPLPSHISGNTIINAISPEKDVDGFHPINVGKLSTDTDRSNFFVPCTAMACAHLLEESGCKVEGKHVVILGRSNIVGKPLASLLLRKESDANATVTVCHSYTDSVVDHLMYADVIVAAIGIPKFVKGYMVKQGVVVIDVGINRIEDSTKTSGFRLVGDVDFESVSYKASAITPVPGGVGPMTIAMLMVNVLKAASIATHKNKENN